MPNVESSQAVVRPLFHSGCVVLKAGGPIESEGIRVAVAPATTSAREGTGTDLVEAYRTLGGTACGDQFAALLRPRWEQPISTLARWIVQRDLISFERQGQLVIPLFQFDGSAIAIRSGVREVMQELSGPYDDWEIADWFARPNEALGGQRPAVRLADDPRGVFEVARSDRYLVAS